MTKPPIAADQRPGSTLTLLEPSQNGGLIQRTVLPGGLRVITETRPEPTIILGISAMTGSRDDPALHGGAHHLMEHLLFQGTRTRSQTDINRERERFGGASNAATAPDHIWNTFQIVPSDLEAALDLACDTFVNSAFDQATMAREIGVVLQEEAARHDSLSTATYTTGVAALFGPESGLGRRADAHTDDLQHVTHGWLQDFYRQRCTPDRLIVAASGPVDHDALVDMVAKRMARTLDTNRDRTPARPRPSTPRVATQDGVIIKPRQASQTHIAVVVESDPCTSPDTAAVRMLAATLGEGPAARLHQEIREKRGLAYYAGTRLKRYSDTGLMMSYAACAPQHAQSTLDAIRDQLDAMAELGITEEELVTAQQSALRRDIITLTQDHRLLRLFHHELYRDRPVSLDTELTQIAALTPQDVAKAAARILGGPRALALVGAVDHEIS